MLELDFLPSSAVPVLDHGVSADGFPDGSPTAHTSCVETGATSLNSVAPPAVGSCCSRRPSQRSTSAADSSLPVITLPATQTSLGDCAWMAEDAFFALRSALATTRSPSVESAEPIWPSLSSQDSLRPRQERSSP